jgi:hypothetical protein
MENTEKALTAQAREIRRDFDRPGFLEDYISLAGILPPDAPAVLHPVLHKELLEKFWNDARQRLSAPAPPGAVVPILIRVRNNVEIHNRRGAIIGPSLNTWQPGPEQLYRLAFAVRNVLALIADAQANNFQGRITLPPPPDLGPRELLLMPHTRNAEPDPTGYDPGLVLLDLNPYEGFISEIPFHAWKRIRRCPKCAKIYWAYRTDARVCSPGCGSAIRVERARKNKPNNAKYKRWQRRKERLKLELHQQQKGQRVHSGRSV